MPIDQDLKGRLGLVPGQELLQKLAVGQSAGRTNSEQRMDLSDTHVVQAMCHRSLAPGASFLMTPILFNRVNEAPWMRHFSVATGAFQRWFDASIVVAKPCVRA